MNALQRIDSLMNGRLMQQTVLINGASGGMLGAAYYRELYLQKLNFYSLYKKGLHLISEFSVKDAEILKYQFLL